MEFRVDGRPLEFEPDALIIAGYTGRDRSAVDVHIAELAEAGIAPPLAIPAFFSVGPDSLVVSDHIQVLHQETSGEVEVVLVVDGEDCYVGIGSDHTDRRAERLDIGVSKQLCKKPLGRELWPLSMVEGRWEDLSLASHITVNGSRDRYQEGFASANIPPEELLGMTPFRIRPERFVLFTGTIPVVGGIRHADHFEGSISDARSAKSLELSYGIQVQELLANG